MVVANSFVTLDSLKDYIELDAHLTIIRTTGSYESSHGVPERALAYQMRVFEDIDGEIITSPALLQSESARAEIRRGFQLNIKKARLRNSSHLSVVDDSINLKRSKKKYPPQINFIPLNRNKGKHEIAFYLNEYLEPIEVFIQFMIAIGDWKYQNNKRQGRLQAYKSFIDQFAYALHQLAVFLYEKKITWDEIDDNYLKEWYDWNLKLTLDKDVSSGDIKTAQRTVNRKIAAIYKFYGWAQYNDFLKPAHVAKEGGRITSTIMESYDKGLLHGPLTKASPKKHPEITQGLYPLQAEKTGEANKEYGITDAVVKSAYEKLEDSKCSAFVRERNILLIDLADQVGLRADSLASLRTYQFHWQDIEEATDHHILIKPERQKLGYDNIFELPVSLASRIMKYIEKERASAMKQFSVSEEKVANALFITEHGNAISAQRISEALASYGIRPHGLRHKFTEGKVYEELAEAAREGRPVDPITISSRLKVALGQKDPSSQKSYFKGRSKLRGEQLEAQLARGNAELLGELHEERKRKADLEAEIRNLKSELAENQSKS